MRRKISIISVLLLALCVSGWSSALACPHAKGEAQRRAMAQDHSCCHAKTMQIQPHCSVPDHEAISDMQPMSVAAVADAVTIEAAGQPTESCAHCMERSELPATPNARQANQVKRNVDEAISEALSPLAPFTPHFAPPVLFRQGSPPGGALTRKHLLISVFII